MKHRPPASRLHACKLQHEAGAPPGETVRTRREMPVAASRRKELVIAVAASDHRRDLVLEQLDLERHDGPSLALCDFRCNSRTGL
jgi:hypothetical protein